MADVIQYFTQLPDVNGYTTISRDALPSALGVTTFDFGVVPQGTQLIAAFAADATLAASPVTIANCQPRINGTLIGFGRSDVNAPVLGDDWAPFTFTVGQQGILTIDFNGGVGWAIGPNNCRLYVYIYIPQVPCP